MHSMLEATQSDIIPTLESGDQESDRTAIACEVNVVDKVLVSRSKMYIWPVSRASAILRPSGD